MKTIDDLPFPLAYLDWCKKKGVKTVKETENIKMVHQFYIEVWEPQGKEVNGLEYAIARGLV